MLNEFKSEVVGCYIMPQLGKYEAAMGVLEGLGWVGVGGCWWVGGWVGCVRACVRACMRVTLCCSLGSMREALGYGYICICICVYIYVYTHIHKKCTRTLAYTHTITHVNM